LTNFSNGKQTQKSLKNGFPESKFQETNMAQKETTFQQTNGALRFIVFLRWEKE
jgi:hypothetical protein